MSGIPGWLLRHSVTVEPFTGTTAYGPTYSAGVAVPCFLDQQTKQVRAPDGLQVVSSSQVYCRLGTVAPAQSRVTLPDGTQTIVINAMQRNGAGLGTPDHLELQLN